MVRPGMSRQARNGEVGRGQVRLVTVRQDRQGRALMGRVRSCKVSCGRHGTALYVKPGLGRVHCCFLRENMAFPIGMYAYHLIWGCHVYHKHTPLKCRQTQKKACFKAFLAVLVLIIEAEKGSQNGRMLSSTALCRLKSPYLFVFWFNWIQGTKTQRLSHF